MIRIVGEQTGKVYVQGSKAECFRELQKKYPYKKRGERRPTTNEHVYQEPLLVLKN